MKRSKFDTDQLRGAGFYINFVAGKYPNCACAHLKELNLVGQVRYHKTVAKNNRCRCSSYEQLMNMKGVLTYLQNLQHSPSIAADVHCFLQEDGMGKFSFRPATAKSIEKITDKREGETSIGFHSIPPKLVKLGSKGISELLSHLINETIIN